MSIRITTLDPSTRSAWEAYVASHPAGTVFHTLVWRDAVQESFHHESHDLMAWRGRDLVGIFPLTRVDSQIAGPLLVSVPYAVYGGSLADDDEAGQALLDHATRLADHQRVRWLDIRSTHRQHAGLPIANRYVTFRKPLPEDPDRVMAELPRKARAAARQARERYGLSSRFASSGLDVVWSLYSQSMRRLASPNYPMRFFRALVRRTEEGRAKQGRVGHLVQIVEHDGHPIAGLLSFIWGETFMPYFVGCDERFEKYHPNNYLYAAAMEQAVRLGCGTFDFGRSRIDNEGSCNFKRFQGFTPTPLEYQYYVPAGGRAPDLTPSHPRIAMARKVWPRLPLAVTRPLGAWLSKSTPG